MLFESFLVTFNQLSLTSTTHYTISYQVVLYFLLSLWWLLSKCNALWATLFLSVMKITRPCLPPQEQSVTTYFVSLLMQASPFTFFLSAIFITFAYFGIYNVQILNRFFFFQISIWISCLSFVIRDCKQSQKYIFW